MTSNCSQNHFPMRTNMSAQSVLSQAFDDFGDFKDIEPLFSFWLPRGSWSKVCKTLAAGSYNKDTHYFVPFCLVSRVSFCFGLMGPSRYKVLLVFWIRILCQSNKIIKVFLFWLGLLNTIKTTYSHLVWTRFFKEEVNGITRFCIMNKKICLCNYAQFKTQHYKRRRRAQFYNTVRERPGTIGCYGIVWGCVW